MAFNNKTAKPQSNATVGHTIVAILLAASATRLRCEPRKSGCFCFSAVTATDKSVVQAVASGKRLDRHHADLFADF
jgi:hypothetical protein